MQQQASDVEVQSEKLFLRITCALVLLLGIPAFFSIIHAPANFEKETRGEIALASDSSRSPASVQATATEGAAPTFAKAETIQIDCKKNVAQQNLQATHLRIKAVNCEGVTHVTNQSNGFTASLVYGKKSEFTTDFIDLAMGRNSVTVSTVDTKGKKIEKILQVQRLPASVQ